MEGSTRNEPRGAGSAALRMRGVVRRFPTLMGLRSRTALGGVDLDVAAGTSLGLIGPNGSGKSTLLRLAAGVDRPTAGSVEVLGVDLAGRGARAARAQLAYLPDDSPFPTELSASAVLELLGSLAGLPRRERRKRGARMLERVGLASAAERPLGTYSKGMLRRFGLAQAFLHDPDLILLDEPTAGLDARGFAVLADLTREAQARGASLVVASHVLSDLHEACERVVVMIDGRAAAAGELDEVLAVSEGGPGKGGSVHVSGLDAAGRESLEAWARERGALVRTERGPGGRVTLSELYRRLESELGQR